MRIELSVVFCAAFLAFASASSQANDGGWPCWSGPGADFSAESGAGLLVSDFAQVRQLWKSESYVPHGKGHNPAGNKLHLGKPSGGGASPIVAEGKVFIWFYQPSGEAYDAMRYKSARESSRYGGDAADPKTWRIDADDVVLAIDAATGKTAWKQVFAGKGINIQSGKDPGISNHTMCYADGRVYALGTMGRIYCLSAADGKLIWEGDNGSLAGLKELKLERLAQGRMVDKLGHSHEHGRGTSGLMIAGGVLIAPTGTHGGGGLVGLDGKIGKQLWRVEEPIRGNQATPALWRHAGKTYVITANRSGRITCLDPVTGKTVWAVTDAGANFQTVTVGGDYLVAKPKLITVLDKKKNKQEPIVDGPIGCYRLSLAGPKLLWTLPFEKYRWNEQPCAIAGGHAYARLGAGAADQKSTNPRGVCIELATGKVKGEFTAPFGGGDACTIVADGRVIADRDGSHNQTSLYLAAADPDNLRSLTNEPWAPPHRPTSAYHPTMTHAYANGRLFIRGADGVYCYDFRRSK